MLRQVFLFLKTEQIFSYFIAQGYNATTLDTLISKRLQPFILTPVEGKIYSKPYFDLQSHFGVFQGVLFLFVTDMADRPKTIAKEIERAAKLFKKNFPDPRLIQESSSETEEFTVFIRETHYFLHPKLALMGPMNSGKSILTTMLRLKDTPDKRIMDFAVYWQIKLGELFFDLWDFIELDDFSSLWKNFIRGTDVIFFIINGQTSAINDRKIKSFMSLKQHDGKYSNWAIILTHQDQPDFIGVDKFKQNYPLLSDVDIFELNLLSSSAKEEILDIFSKIIGLKQALPSNFRSRLVQANKLVGSEVYSEAIIILKELSEICVEYQEFAYLDVFRKKITELTEKQQTKEETVRREEQKIKAPTQVAFGKFSGPKSFPGAQGKPLPPPSIPSPTPSPEKLPTSPPISSLEATEEDFSSLDTSVVSDIKSSNPFFGSLTPLSTEPPVSEPVQPLPKSSTPSPLDVPLTFNPPPLPKMPDLAPVENFEIRIHKVHPIDLREFDSPRPPEKHTQIVEEAVSSSLAGMTDQKPKNKSGETRSKILTLQRSPLVSQTLPQKKADILKTREAIPVQEKNPLANFTLGPEQGVINDAEHLGSEIRALGESLSLEMCRKFIAQLKIRMKKTNLTESDIKKAASLYVIQRRRTTT
ncbi:MAG: GTPase domain-containing protein [Promethearchaeota archaeon]